jgi:putative tryptophan/tyrosine transport system substrate-binding protein
MRFRTRRRILQAGLSVAGMATLVGCSTPLPVRPATRQPHRIGYLTASTLEAGHETAKRLELLMEGFPGLQRVAALRTQRESTNLAQAEAAARTLNVQILSLELRNPDELESVLSDGLTNHADALIVFSDAVLMPLAARIVAFAALHRLPAIYGTSTYARVGGLMVYGVNIPDNLRRTAGYVDKILKGAKPADLPVERPTKYDFVVNLKAARSQGFAIPSSILEQATEIIQ